MFQNILVVVVFILALGIGILLGKKLRLMQSQLEKNQLEEQMKGLLSQMEIQKQQLDLERKNFENQVKVISLEKEVLRNDREAIAIQLSKK